MNKKAIAIVAVILCIALLTGCSASSSMVGVYQSVATQDRIILYKDGDCEYLGYEDATWNVNGDTLTITLHLPDRYGLDVYLNNEVLTEAEARAITAKINVLENVESCTYVQNGVYVQLKKADTDKETARKIAQLPGVLDVKEMAFRDQYTLQKLTVLDGCLIEKTGGQDVVFEKIGE